LHISGIEGRVEIIQSVLIEEVFLFTGVRVDSALSRAQVTGRRTAISNGVIDRRADISLVRLAQLQAADINVPTVEKVVAEYGHRQETALLAGECIRIAAELDVDIDLDHVVHTDGITRGQICHVVSVAAFRYNFTNVGSKSFNFLTSNRQSELAVYSQRAGL
jgi:hypothetical protein